MLHHGRCVPRACALLCGRALRFTGSFFLPHKTANLLARRHREMLMASFVRNLPCIYSPPPLTGFLSKEKKEEKKQCGQRQNIDLAVCHPRVSHRDNSKVTGTPRLLSADHASPPLCRPREPRSRLQSPHTKCQLLYNDPFCFTLKKERIH